MRLAILFLAIGFAIGCGDDDRTHADTGPVETYTFDSSMITFDSAPPGRPDTGRPDTGRPDTGRPDTNPPDTRPPEPECRGIALSCSSTSVSYSCIERQGCRWNADCGGVSTGCYLLNRFQCGSQRGCYWSTSFDDCSGSSTPCRLISESSCSRQRGCYLRTSCSGVARRCPAILSRFSCDAQPGCYWSAP